MFSRIVGEFLSASSEIVEDYQAGIIGDEISMYSGRDSTPFPTFVLKKQDQTLLRSDSAPVPSTAEAVPVPEQIYHSTAPAAPSNRLGQESPESDENFDKILISVSFGAENPLSDENIRRCVESNAGSSVVNVTRRLKQLMSLGLIPPRS